MKENYKFRYGQENNSCLTASRNRICREISLENTEDGI